MLVPRRFRPRSQANPPHQLGRASRQTRVLKREEGSCRRSARARAKKRSLGDYIWGTYSPRDNPVDTWLVKRQRMAPPHYRFYWSDLSAIARWVAETPNAASVLPWHVVEPLAREGRLEFEDIGKDAVTRLFLAYAKGHPHQRFLKALSLVGREE